MEKSRLIQVLKTFSSSEMEQLELYVESPFFKPPAHARELFFVLKEFHPDFSGIATKGVFEEVFSNSKAFDKVFFNNVLGNFLKYIETFMAHYQLKQNKLQQSYFAFEYYSQKPLYPIFATRYRNLSNSLKQSDFKDMHEWLLGFQINLAYYFHPDTPKLHPNLQVMQDMIGYLDDFYIANKLKLATELSLRSRIFSESYRNYFMEEILSQSVPHSSPQLSLYRSFNDMVNHPTSLKYFQKAKNLYAKNNKTLHPITKANFLHLLIQKANSFVFSGHTTYRKTQFELYKIGIEQKLFLLTGCLNDAIFYNIVATSAILRKFKYARQFIHQYQSLLYHEKKEDVIALSKSFLFFHQGNFEKADQLFVKHHFKEQRYKLLANSLHLRCLYESTLVRNNYNDTFFKFSEAFKRFIQRNKLVPENRKVAYYNLITITKQMVQYRNAKARLQPKYLSKIKELIQQDVVAKEWLENKIQQL